MFADFDGINALQPLTGLCRPPGTGKLQALKEVALQPMHSVRTERDTQNCIIEKCTSSALVKTVAEHKKAFIISPEVFEVLNKLLKSDE